jgi:hypothetical protein
MRRFTFTLRSHLRDIRIAERMSSLMIPTRSWLTVEQNLSGNTCTSMVAFHMIVGRLARIYGVTKSLMDLTSCTPPSLANGTMWVTTGHSSKTVLSMVRAPELK